MYSGTVVKGHTYILYAEACTEKGLFTLNMCAILIRLLLHVDSSTSYLLFSFR